MANPNMPDPTTDFYREANQPYRGIQTHGVKPTAKPLEEDLHGQTAINWEEHVPEDDEPNPVPVRIITQYRKETIEWNGSVFLVTDRPILLVPRLESRTEVFVSNQGPDSVYLSPNAPSAIFNAPVELNLSGTFTTKSVGAIWAICASGESASVRVVWEYVRIDN